MNLEEKTVFILCVNLFIILLFFEINNITLCAEPSFFIFYIFCVEFTFFVCWTPLPLDVAACFPAIVSAAAVDGATGSLLLVGLVGLVLLESGLAPTYWPSSSTIENKYLMIVCRTCWEWEIMQQLMFIKAFCHSFKDLVNS